MRHFQPSDAAGSLYLFTPAGEPFGFTTTLPEDEEGANLTSAEALSLAKGAAALEQPLAKVMTRKPICLRENALAADAIHIFNERNIDDLIVINVKREPIGLIDSQDLPKLKAV